MTDASRPWRASGALLALLLVSCTSAAALPPLLPHPNGQALGGSCMTSASRTSAPVTIRRPARSSPSPRARRTESWSEASNGVAQFLVMPTAKITGIEDPALLAPDAANYFAIAWTAKRYVEGRLGHSLDRTQVSVAVNSIYGRSQDQLHLHVDCLDASVGATLGAAGASHDGRWASVQLKGHGYRVRWLDDAALQTTNPFMLLAASLPDARRSMAAWTLALVGARGSGGAQGFYLLADRANLAAGDRGSAEELQDHACRSS